MPEDKLLKPAEAAHLLDVTEDWVYRYWKTELKGCAMKLRGQLRFCPVALRAYIAKKIEEQTNGRPGVPAE
jgi:hypothetical protein